MPCAALSLLLLNDGDDAADDDVDELMLEWRCAPSLLCVLVLLLLFLVEIDVASSALLDACDADDADDDEMDEMVEAAENDDVSLLRRHSDVELLTSTLALVYLKASEGVDTALVASSPHWLMKTDCALLVVVSIGLMMLSLLLVNVVADLMKLS